MKKLVPLFVTILFLQTSCKKDTKYVYQVQDQQLYQTAAQKTNLKSTTQFITIAYNDLFNAAITNGELTKLNVDLLAFGDKSLIQDMIVKGLLNRTTANVPDNATMRGDISTFVQQTYLRFYNRKPNEFEAWKMQDIIQKNTDITPQMIYYSVMTSDEYRYY